MKSTLTFLVLIATCVSTVTLGAQNVRLIDAGTDDRIERIEGLVLSGTTYDVVFHHGLSFRELKPIPRQKKAIHDQGQFLFSALGHRRSIRPKT